MDGLVLVAVAVSGALSQLVSLTALRIVLLTLRDGG